LLITLDQSISNCQLPRHWLIENNQIIQGAIKIDAVRFRPSTLVAHQVVQVMLGHAACQPIRAKTVTKAESLVARSRFAVARRMVNRRRSVVLASLQNSQALSKASMSCWVKGSTGASSKRGAGTAFMGLGTSSSMLAHLTKADRVT
jgi:hypothetical protein